MSLIDELDRRTREFLTRRGNDLPVRISDGNARLEALGGEDLNKVFSVFIPSHQRQATVLTNRFVEIADALPGDDGLQAVLDAAEAEANDQNLDLVQHALMVFITNHKDGRRLPIPSLAERRPEDIVPSLGDSAFAVALGLEALGALGVEAQLDYFREDTWVNEHHTKWHLVYRGDGWQGAPKSQQGQLFWYMHQQMLARYDAERLAFGLPPVEPLNNYRAIIAEGYDANLQQYSNRAANDTMQELPDYSIADHELYRERLLNAAREGFLRRSDGQRVPITPALFGGTLEPNIGSVEGSNYRDEQSFYGQHHNSGHALIAYAAGLNQIPGVMISTRTAVRDPVFFRWHRHVDDIFHAWQETQAARNFTAEPTPPVVLRKSLGGAPLANQSPDILFCLQERIPGAANADFNGQAWGEANFGGENWDKPPSEFAQATDTLTTVMRQQAGKPYLDHKEFYYFFRLQNQSDARQRVTVRVFAVPTAYANDRRMYIEMDKFLHELAPHQKSVVFRPARLSSVVRKPALRPNEPRPAVPPGTVRDDYCDCGWAYHLLLPRGNGQGMDFRLFVMLTDWQADLVGTDRKCGSVSFCGAKDREYPDNKPMGYPFDCPFKNLSIAETTTAQPNMAARDFKIKFSTNP